MGQHIAKLSFPGILPSGEQFDYSYWWAHSTGADVSLDSAISWGAAWMTSLGVAATFRALFSSGMTFKACQASVVDMATGKTVTAGSGGTQFIGSSASNPLPPQVAVCVTLYTALAGPSNRGRFYLPSPILSDSSTGGRMSSSDITGLLTALKNAGSSIVSVDNTAIPVVYSRTHRSIQPVTVLSIGDVFDTQRRRRDKLVEVRQTNTPY